MRAVPASAGPSPSEPSFGALCKSKGACAGEEELMRPIPKHGGVPCGEVGGRSSGAFLAENTGSPPHADISRWHRGTTSHHRARSACLARRAAGVLWPSEVAVFDRLSMQARSSEIFLCVTAIAPWPSLWAIPAYGRELGLFHFCCFCPFVFSVTSLPFGVPGHCRQPKQAFG